MRSHRYQFTAQDVFRHFGPLIAAVALLAGLLHGAAVLGWLPAPRPTVDVDRTILVHQAEASRRPHPARTLLIGDSSCLMDVAAGRLGEILGEPVLNLATLSYLDLPTHAVLVREFDRANPGRLQRVILLMHPESLRLRVVPEYFRRQVLDFLAGRDSPAKTGMARRIEQVLGVQRLRGRVLSRATPWPLPGAYGRFYGFSRDLELFMEENAGSAVDPHRFVPEREGASAEYRLAPRFESESRRFRQLLPEGVQLLVGITPSPRSFVLPDHTDRCRSMLQQWAAWLEADRALESLPAVLPDDQFASRAHLNAQGRLPYTRQLARALQADR
ncbi:MAG: hypothetical protein D6766_04325 [Verrucomicrobia bacterium]|nr:MAG: hypothetical protein D6766_04325 [Verrucomicrobiota bacterium]